MPATTPKQSRMAFDDKNGDDNGDNRQKVTYVRCDLSADQKKELAEWANAKSADDCIDYLNELVQEGYIITVKPGKEQGYQANLTHSRPVAASNKNGGKSLVTRASTPERVLWSLLYKYYEVLGRDLTQGQQTADMDW